MVFPSNLLVFLFLTAIVGCSPLTKIVQEPVLTTKTIQSIKFLSPNELKAQTSEKSKPILQTAETKLTSLQHRASLLRKPVLSDADRSNLLKGPNKLD
jgi:hypothetical protein|tara:strand:- start:39 stop:332 length:294 start_codon:yes stop_codon:yes gene_type:complete